MLQITARRSRRSHSISRDRQLLPLPDKPSIAVLPFQNMSGDPEQEYFADGLAQEAEAHAQLALRLSPRGYGIGTPTLRLQWRTSRCATMPKPCAGANLQSRFRIGHRSAVP